MCSRQKRHRHIELPGRHDEDEDDYDDSTAGARVSRGMELGFPEAQLASKAQLPDGDNSKRQCSVDSNWLVKCETCLEQDTQKRRPRRRHEFTLPFKAPFYLLDVTSFLIHNLQAIHL
jgi:hypothetical protein